MWEALEILAPVIIHKLDNNFLLGRATVNFERHDEGKISVLERIVSDYFAHFAERQFTRGSISMIYSGSDWFGMLSAYRVGRRSAVNLGPSQRSILPCGE